MNVSNGPRPASQTKLSSPPKTTSNPQFAAVLKGSAERHARAHPLEVPLRADEQENWVRRPEWLPEARPQASSQPTAMEAPERAPAIAIPEGTQFALSVHGPETDARFVVPEGRVAGVEFFMRAEGKRLRVRTEDSDGAAYMRTICARLRHRGYDAELEDDETR